MLCRVAATNRAGVGEFAAVPGKVLAKDLLLSPDVEVDASLRQALKVCMVFFVLETFVAAQKTRFSWTGQSRKFCSSLRNISWKSRSIRRVAQGRRQSSRFKRCWYNRQHYFTFDWKFNKVGQFFAECYIFCHERALIVCSYCCEYQVMNITNVVLKKNFIDKIAKGV